MKIRIEDAQDAHNISNIVGKYKDIDFDCICGRYIIDLKSIMGILSIGLPKTVDIVVHSDNDIVLNNVSEKLERWKI